MPTLTHSAFSVLHPDSLNLAEPPCTDPYARWCDRERPRGPTYVDSGFAASVHVVRHPGAKDVSEWLDQDQDQERTADDLLPLLQDAPAWEPPPDDPRETGRTGRR